jgi:hypothetical protein
LLQPAFLDLDRQFSEAERFEEGVESLESGLGLLPDQLDCENRRAATRAAGQTILALLRPRTRLPGLSLHGKRRRKVAAQQQALTLSSGTAGGRRLFLVELRS